MQYLVLPILIFCSLQASNCGAPELPLENGSLISVVKTGSLEKVRASLRQDEDANSRDVHGSTPLHWACYLDKKGDIIKALLQAGAQIDAKDIDGWIPLDWAGKTSNPSAIKQLLQKAVDLQNVKILDQDGKTLLHYAVALKDEESNKIVERLLALSLDPNMQNKYGRTPLHEAVRNKDIDIKVMEMLLKAGARTNVQDNNGNTPLGYATRKEVIVLLLLHSNH